MSDAYVDGSMSDNVSLAEQESYWLERLSGELPLLQLPNDYPRPLVRSFEGTCLRFLVNYELTSHLRCLAASQGANLYMVFLASFQVLLAKYSGHDDIIIGSLVVDDPYMDSDLLMDKFKAIPIRNMASPEKTFVNFLEEVKQNTLAAFVHQDYPFDNLVNKLSIEKNIHRNTIFDTMFVYHNLDSAKWMFEDLTLVSTFFDNKVAKFDLTIHVVEKEGELFFEFIYAKQLFASETIDRMGQHFIQLLESVIENPISCIGDLDMVTENEKSQILTQFKGISNKYAAKTLHEVFGKRAKERSNSDAIIFGTRAMTYKELNAKSDDLALRLQEKGVKPNDVVGIMVERSFEMILFILAVLKSGASYLPIDSEFSTERIKFILSDSNTKLLLVKEDPRFEVLPNVMYLVVKESELSIDRTEPIVYVTPPDHVAYVIYTSGSTGNPKGVSVKHSGVVNVLSYLEYHYPVKDNDAFLLKTTFTFDMSVTELFGWFFGLGRLAILEQGAEKDPLHIFEAIERYNVTHINFVPSMLRMFPFESEEIRSMEKLKFVFLSGEAVPTDLVDRFYSSLHGVRLENLYGPTEATIYATRCSLEPTHARNISIGKPIANTQIYIVNGAGQLQPIGLPGEMYIGGEGVALGYMNNPVLTAEKFLLNPYENGGKLYRTGDISRWLADGSLEYLGRIDHQVKIRGHRIELDEIRLRLIELEHMENAVVVARSDENKNSYLCAYYISKQEWSVTELRKKLLESLPHYMLPSFFIRMEEFPHTVSGKIDRKKLPEMKSILEIGEPYVEPRDEIEKVLCDYWKNHLGIDTVSILDDFFNLGGDSLKAILIVMEFNKNTKRWRLSVGQVLLHRTIERIAQHIERGDEYIRFDLN